MAGKAGMERSLQERDRTGVQDCVLLEDFTCESAFIQNLKKRFSENLIYALMRRKTYYNQRLVPAVLEYNVPNSLAPFSLHGQPEGMHFRQFAAKYDALRSYFNEGFLEQ